MDLSGLAEEASKVTNFQCFGETERKGLEAMDFIGFLRSNGSIFFCCLSAF